MSDLTPRRAFLISTAMGCAAPAWGAAVSPWPTAKAIPGGVALVALGAAAQRPAVQLDDRRVLVLGDESGWTAVVLSLIHI